MWQIQGKTPAINQTDKPILDKSDLFAACYQGDQSSLYKFWASTLQQWYPTLLLLDHLYYPITCLLKDSEAE